MKHIINLIVGILITLSLAGCSLKKESTYTGKTMGTTYMVKVVTWFYNPTGDIHKKIKIRLKEINSSMSTYMKTSEISRFNNDRSGENFKVSQDFYQVMKTAGEIHTITSGAWDGTVNPLVNLWGFGGENSMNSVPSKENVNAIMSHVGFHLIGIEKDEMLHKKNPLVSLDLASIAKGYAVDQIAMLISKEKIGDYLVEIGGEIVASGFRKDGNMWRVGINMPRKNAPVNQVYKAIRLQSRALATSGDYRNFFEMEGKFYSHVINPKTGFPVSNGVVSASVLSPTCMFADGLATAIMVMGHEKGIELVNTLDDVECLIVVRDFDNTLTDYVSEGFPLED